MKKKKFKVVLATDRKGRELQTLSNICGEKEIPFHFFDVRHDIIKSIRYSIVSFHKTITKLPDAFEQEFY